ncbi:MAG TPA: hypothetical protein VIJ22_05485 [Polyangiaceae bacterium]
MGRVASWLLGLAALVAALLLVGGAYLGLEVSSALVACEESLDAAPEPAGWRDWTAEENHWDSDTLGEFKVEYKLSSPKYWMGYYEVSLVEPGVCPHQGASVEPWFGRGTEHDTSWYRNPAELTVRRSPASDVYAVSGRLSGRGEDTFVSAFRRHREHRVVLASHRAATFLGIDMLVLLVVGIAMGMARRELVLAREVEDPERFAEGIRDGGGAVQVDNESVTDGPGIRGRAGVVLVERVARDGGSYRTAPSARAGRVIEGTRGEAARLAKGRAAKVLLGAMAVVGATWVGVVGWAIGEFLSSPGMY